jgi:hypothetical protein
MQTPSARGETDALGVEPKAMPSSSRIFLIASEMSGFSREINRELFSTTVTLEPNRRCICAN